MSTISVPDCGLQQRMDTTTFAIKFMFKGMYKPVS
jgi:hypothetical protein